MKRRISRRNLRVFYLEKVLSNTILRFSKKNINKCCECEFRYACHNCCPDSLSDNVYDKMYNCIYDVYNVIL